MSAPAKREGAPMSYSIGRRLSLRLALLTMAIVGFIFWCTWNAVADQHRSKNEREMDFRSGVIVKMLTATAAAGDENAIREKIESPKNVLAALLERTVDDRAITDALYVRALARTPTEKEWATLQGFLAAETQAGRTRRRAFENLLWALLNSKEFQLNQ